MRQQKTRKFRPHGLGEVHEVQTLSRCETVSVYLLTRHATPLAVWCFWSGLTFFSSACGTESPQEPKGSGAGVAGQLTSPSPSSTSGAAGAVSDAGAPAGGAASSPGGAPALGGAGTPSAGSANGGVNAAGAAGGGFGGVSSSAGAAGAGSTAGAPLTIPAGCMVSSPVSFKKDIGPWLAGSCGKSSGSGCHVTDDSSTAGSLCPDGTKTCGFNHAYDWITAGSHNQFCKQPQTPIRYTVVMAVLEGENPPSCTKTRVMPPDGPRATECEKAALAAWLAEPKVLQAHRADDTSPAEPYLMPPFN